MTDYNELKRLATRIVEVQTSQDVPISKLFDDFDAATSPEVVLALIAENEQLAKTADCWDRLNIQNKALSDSFRNERDQLKAENELARMRIKEMDLLFGRYILAMRSALIEEEHGKGPAAAMQWIYNSLAGPGELPPEGETDSQAYFDREIIAVDDGMQEVMAFHDGRRAALGQGEQL